MTIKEDQDMIDDAINFVVTTQNGIIAEVNQQNTVIKANSRGDIETFLGSSIKKHIVMSGNFYDTIRPTYPILRMVVSGLGLEPPTKLYYKQNRILIAEFDGFVIGIAPVCDKQ